MSDVFPRIRPLGVTGYLIQFADALSETANRAALGFRAYVDAQGWGGVEETATALASVFVRFDPKALGHDDLHSRLCDALTTRDWFAADLPAGRRLWHVPCAFGGDLGPQLAEAAKLAGETEAEAIGSFTAQPVQVLALGFAPGQPYMGTLPDNWNIPRQTGLTKQMKRGALVVAIRQLIIYAADAPTGWRHVGQTRFECFNATRDPAFALKAGDMVQLHAVDASELDNTAPRSEPLA
jgi:KipI family sensor histidine kinase inhibitor